MNTAIAEGILEIINCRSPQAWIAIDASLNIVYINEACCKMWQRYRNELEGRPLAELLYNGANRVVSGSCNSPLIKTLNSGQELRDAEVHICDPQNNCHYWFLSNTYLIQDKQGNPCYVLGNYIEIDKFKAIENRVKGINISIIKAFAKAIGTRDAYTLQHEEHVATLMTGLAETMDMPAEDISTAYLAGLVHDVGKLGVSERLLNKPSSLTPEEYDLIKLHSAMGADILSEVDGFKDIAAIVRFHHERFDGTGYPARLAGCSIPVFSRMLAVCDAYDAMTTLRCYRQPVMSDEALLELERCAGTQFDPVICEKFVSYIRETGSKQLCS